MCEETDGLTDMVKPTYAIQLCCEWYKKKLAFFLQIKGHKPWTEHIFKSKIKLGVPFMVPDLVYKWEELKLLNGGEKKSLQTQIKHNALRPNDRGIKMVTSVNENVILHFKKQLETQKQYLVLSYKHIFISI